MKLLEACGLADLLLGRRPDRLESFRPVAGGDDSHSFRVWDRDKALLLKVMARPGTPIGAYFYGRLREAGIPVPNLVALSPDGGPGGRACGIFEWVEGTPAEFDSHDRPPYDEDEFGAARSDRNLPIACDACRRNSRMSLEQRPRRCSTTATSCTTAA